MNYLIRVIIVMAMIRTIQFLNQEELLILKTVSILLVVAWTTCTYFMDTGRSIRLRIAIILWTCTGVVLYCDTGEVVFTIVGLGSYLGGAGFYILYKAELWLREKELHKQEQNSKKKPNSS